MSATRSMLYYALAIVVLRGTSFVMLPVVTSYVEASDYGVLNLLNSFTAIAGLLLTFGLGECIYRFASNQDESNKRRIFSLCFSLSVAGSLLVIIPVLVFADAISAWFPLHVEPAQLRNVLITLACSAITTVPYAIWRLQAQARHFCVFAIAHTGLQTVVTLLLLHCDFGINANLIAGAVAGTVTSGWLLWHFRALLSFKSTKPHIVRWQYAVSMMLSMFTLYFLNGAEQWIIAAHIGATALAGYFIAAQFGLAVALAIEPYKMWWFARRFRSIEEPKINNPLFSVLGTELACLAALLVMFAIPVLLPLVLSADYLQATKWLPWICLVTVLRQQSEFLNLGCYVKFDGKVPFIINLISASTMLSLALWWVDSMHLQGVLLAMLVANALRVVLFFIISQVLLYQQYNIQRLVLMWLWLMLAFVASAKDFYLGVLFALVLHGTSIAFHYSALWLPLVKRVFAAIEAQTKTVVIHD